MTNVSAVTYTLERQLSLHTTEEQNTQDDAYHFTCLHLLSVDGVEGPHCHDESIRRSFSGRPSGGSKPGKDVGGFW